MSGSFNNGYEDNCEDDEPEEVQGPPPPPYTGPRFDDGIDEYDVHATMAFLVAIEPPLGSVNTRAEYEAATGSRRDEIAVKQGSGGRDQFAERGLEPVRAMAALAPPQDGFDWSGAGAILQIGTSSRAFP